MRSPRFLASVIALLMLCALPLAAQTTTARIEGLVSDNTGAALPGVTVTATNLATNSSLTDVSDSKGLYTITPLQVGNYRVSFELSGFKTANVPAKLEVGQVARIDMKMELGTVSETLTVTAAAPVIERTTSQISTVIERKQVEDLPLNGRNFTQLATLSPGVTRGVPGSNAAGDQGQAETFRYGEFGGAALSVNGLREQFNNYIIEGVDNNEALVNTIAYMPSPEAIQEFSVITTNAPAEYGRAGGAVQNLVIKSGTNDFHGSAFYFYRPKSLAATPKFSPEKPNFKNEDFGAAFGGPIVRDRVFFFGDFHGLRNSIPVEAGNYVTVPTLKMRNGDFSELLDPKVSGFGQPVIIYDPVTGQPFAGNIIPSSRFNAAGKAYLNAFPQPTNSAITRNFLTHRQRQSTYNDFDGKLDTSLASSDQLFFSGSHWNDSFSDPGRIPGFQAGFGSGTSENKGYTLRLGETHLFSGNLINEFRVGRTSYNYGFLPVGYGTDQDKALGIGGPGGITVGNGISLIGGGNGFYIEYLGDFGQYIITQKMWQASDAVTYLHGTHSFKFGGTALQRGLDQQRTNFGKGFYFFRDAFGFQPGYTGYEVSDMLIGKTNFTATGVPGYVPRRTVNWENAVFAQDDWHIMPNLTLNLGLRWDVITPYYEKDNRLANYDPVTQRLVLPDQNGASRSTIDTDWNNFGPRVGFNYLLSERLAFRGGYGVFYSPDRGGIDLELTENPPAVVTEFRFGDTPGANVSLSDPIPLPTVVNPNSPSLPQGSGVVYIPRNTKTTQVQQWSLSTQYEIDRNTSGMVAYVGTRGSNLSAQITSAGFAGAVADRLSTLMYIGKSKYDALQLSLRRRESNGLSYLASYTYGNAKNNTPGPFAGNPSRGGSIIGGTQCVASGATSCDLSSEWGPADYDVRHRFTFAATYDLPWARENRYIGGWAINTVVTLQTGNPFTVYSDFGGLTRADQNGNPNNGPENTNQWFKTNVFTKAAGSQGTAGRNSVRGPGIHTVDLSLFKRFAVMSNSAVELRIEGFNIFNSAIYNQPNNVVADPNFGKITGTRINTERQVQLAARFIF